MIWVLGVLCALALVALFFPFVFWADFSANFNRVTVHVRFFKKVVYTFEKKFGKKELSEDEDSALSDNEDSSVAVNDEETAVAPSTPVESKAAPKEEQKVEPEQKSEPEKTTEPESKTEPAKTTEPVKLAAEPEKLAEKKDESKPVEKKEPAKAEEKKPSEEKSSDDEEKEKRSLTDEEFWTLLLTPEFDVRAWWAVRHALSALFKLFRIRFVDCFVEGLRMEYETMGYAAALNGFLKSFPYIGAWDFRMDWTRDHEPHAEGHVRASINVCRVLGMILAILFYGGIVAFTFWRRRAKILKTGELPELGFIRNKIVKMMSEDD